MEELQKKHRQEQRDLQARITQKKKSATKKTRKGVNDECAELERQLKETQNLEISDINGESYNNGHPSDINDNDLCSEGEPSSEVKDSAIENDMQSPSVSFSQPKDERTKKPNHQKARLARRAAEKEFIASQAAKEAKGQPDLRQQESEAMRTLYTSRGLSEHQIQSDGHCLYAAVADQLTSREQNLVPKHSINGTLHLTTSSAPPYKITRTVAASYIDEHADDFLPFLEESLDDYLSKIRDTGEWGGHLELLALAKAYDVDINVLQSSGHVEKIGSGTDGPKPALWLSYYHHNFGLGEHYNSLRQNG
ncbi:MAG: hypothetical protein LQ343_001372 [Gyalolechia ehrenbergii]|nr:MAG: hypothetical protein LQ343_001372 [Gyalolechia ehrenbergii]